MEDDVAQKMFLVKDFEVEYLELENQRSPETPHLHLVMLRLQSEVGSRGNVMESPPMFLSAKLARELGQRLIQQAEKAVEMQRTSPPQSRH